MHRLHGEQFLNNFYHGIIYLLLHLLMRPKYTSFFRNRVMANQGLPSEEFDRWLKDSNPQPIRANAAILSNLSLPVDRKNENWFFKVKGRFHLKCYLIIISPGRDAHRNWLSDELPYSFGFSRTPWEQPEKAMHALDQCRQLSRSQNVYHHLFAKFSESQ